MKKYLKNVYDAGTIAFHYTILYSLYSDYDVPNDIQNPSFYLLKSSKIFLTKKLVTHKKHSLTE